MSSTESREKLRRVMLFIQSDRDRFEVTEEKIDLWTQALGWAPEAVLKQAAANALATLKTGFINLAHIRAHLPERTNDKQEYRRTWEEVFQIILADCSFSEPDPPPAHASLQASLDGYRSWREKHPGGFIFPPPSWTLPHLSPENLLAFLDRHSRPVIVEQLDF